MKILLDTADIDFIRDNIETMPIIGVTTNPTIVTKAHLGHESVVNYLLRLRRVLGKNKELHIQLTETTYQNMIEEAYLIKKLFGDKFNNNVYVKVPVSDVGLKVIKKLTEDGINVTATAILTATQALLCAEAGAKYVAPYVSRLDNISADGVQTVADIATLFANGGYETKILAASFKTTKEVLDSALAGADCVTVSPETLKLMYSHPTTTTSIDNFDKDWKGAFGKTLYELMKEHKENA